MKIKERAIEIFDNTLAGGFIDPYRRYWENWCSTGLGLSFR
jgi:hypothetical protein